MMSVSERFTQFLKALQLTPSQYTDGVTKHSGVRSALNSNYYGTSSGVRNSFLVGSWGKSTEIRPPRDIDVMFELPVSVYRKYEKVSGNKQSQLLQEVKRVLERTYPRTRMKGDGPVVVIPFTTYSVELVPAFKLDNGQYLICDTKAGGKYKTTNPNAEIKFVEDSDDRSGGNTRDLIRMLKRWQSECNVPLKSIVIELLAIDFLSSWQYANSPRIFYDWMVRDFFQYLVGKADGVSWVYVPGTYEMIWIGGDWKYKAETALKRAENATKYEEYMWPYSAGAEWQEIFGTDIPIG